MNKLLPDLRSESVSEHEPDFVLTFFRALGCVEEVAANFANVLSSLGKIRFSLVDFSIHEVLVLY